MPGAATTDGAYTAVFEHTGPLNPKDVELIQVVKIGDTVKQYQKLTHK